MGPYNSGVALPPGLPRGNGYWAKKPTNCMNQQKTKYRKMWGSPNQAFLWNLDK